MARPVCSSVFIALAMVSYDAAGQTPDAASVSGRVTVRGPVPPPVTYSPTKDLAVCHAETHVSDEWMVDAERGLGYVVVSLEGVPARKPTSAVVPVTIDQRGCRFVPHVTLVPAGATVEILNSDGILHNVRTTSVKNPAFNKAQPKAVRKMKHVFNAAPETIRVQCDAHSWMSAWIVVQDHPYYAVTDIHGRFTLPDVPAGRYTVNFWHERLGKQAVQVTVPAGGVVNADYAFTVK